MMRCSDNLEEVLITSDVGVETTLRIIGRIEERVARDKYVGTSELNGILKEEIAGLFLPKITRICQWILIALCPINLM